MNWVDPLHNQLQEGVLPDLHLIHAIQSEILDQQNNLNHLSVFLDLVEREHFARLLLRTTIDEHQSAPWTLSGSYKIISTRAGTRIERQ